MTARAPALAPQEPAPPAADPARAALDAALDRVRAEPSRTWSIIITLYGDAIVPRGGSVWLGTLLAFFRALGLSDGVVRTAASRLASDGWLERRRVGRNSFYRLAGKGTDSFRRATQQIYHPRAPRWRGRFELVLPEAGADREQVRADLEAAGFGAPAPGVWVARPGEAVPDLPFPVLRLEAQGDDDVNRALAARSWPIDATADAYRRFLAAFDGLRRALNDGGSLADLDALVARVLLIHEYRRAVLRDPVLPTELLADAWPGAAARELCAEVYGHLLRPSERWLDANAVDESGGPLPPARGLAGRFKPESLFEAVHSPTSSNGF